MFALDNIHDMLLPLNNEINKVKQFTNKPIILCGKKEIFSSCLHCTNPKCIKYEESELGVKKFEKIPIMHNLNVCPVDAIKQINQPPFINIDNKKCLKCGLCASRCPLGAIYKDKDNFLTNCDINNLIKVVVNKKNRIKQDEYINKINLLFNKRLIQDESTDLLDKTLVLIEKFKNKEIFDGNLLIRNMLIQLGLMCSLTRTGDVYFRMDGFYYDPISNNGGPIEIDYGNDSLENARRLLDDVAVLNYKNIIPKISVRPVSIYLNLPNNRQDYMQLVLDIEKIYNIKIKTLSVGALLVLLWSGKTIVLNDDNFYYNFNSKTIEKDVENLLSRKLKIKEDKYNNFKVK